MVIAVITRTLSGDIAAADFLVSYFQRVAAANMEHQFYFISEKESNTGSQQPNVQHIVINQQAANPLLWKLWYNYKLPPVVKKIKADILVSTGSVASLRTKLPQLLIVNDAEFFHHPEWYSKRYISYMKSALPASLQKAIRIVAFSRAVKKEVAASYPVHDDNIFVSSFGYDKNCMPLSWDEKITVKEKYTGGNEYFLYHGSIHDRANLVHLLKAFSLFKKRQKSSLQLVLLTDKIPAKNEFVDSLRLYKYRDEIQLIQTTGEEDTNLLTAAAWCVVNLSPVLGDVLRLKQAALYEVPVIAPGNKQAGEILGDAALYVNPASVNSIADGLMAIYKDEEKQCQLVEKGKDLKKGSIVNDLWHHITAVVNNSK